MFASNIFSTNLMVAYTVYLVGVSSPGPSNLAIMGTAMEQGRKHALALAAGVMSGSLLWGVLAAFGLASIMQKYSILLIAIKFAGGIYLFWLSWKAAKEAYVAKPLGPSIVKIEKKDCRHAYARGAVMHLTNPKAIFVWLSIVSLALSRDATASDAMKVVFGCSAIGIIVFGTYAVAFSAQAVRQLYQSVRRWFNAVLSCVFAYAGIRMLLSSRNA